MEISGGVLRERGSNGGGEGGGIGFEITNVKLFIPAIDISFPYGTTENVRRV